MQKEEIKLGEEERVRERAPVGYGGASIALIAVYAAINGATSLVPFFPYVGGGGFLPLCVVFEALGPLVLGPIGGVIAAVIGGAIGMFVSPAAYPLGPLDILLTGTIPALFVALTLNADDTRIWIMSLLVMIVMAVMFIIYPYIWPGIPNEPWDIMFFASGLIFWLPWLILELTPVGKSWIPEWARSDDPKFRYLGTFLAILFALEFWYIPWTVPYWHIYVYAIAVSTSSNLFAYSWWIPALAVVTTIIAIPVIEALKRSGLPRIPRSTW